MLFFNVTIQVLIEPTAAKTHELLVLDIHKAQSFKASITQVFSARPTIHPALCPASSLCFDASPGHRTFFVQEWSVMRVFAHSQHLKFAARWSQRALQRAITRRIELTPHFPCAQVKFSVSCARNLGTTGKYRHSLCLVPRCMSRFLLREVSL